MSRLFRRKYLLGALVDCHSDVQEDENAVAADGRLSPREEVRVSAPKARRGTAATQFTKGNEGKEGASNSNRTQIQTLFCPRPCLKAFCDASTL
jgi:hypothetical protein